jgi:benzylsuccinate CoA-transferase BbsF subunit
MNREVFKGINVLEFTIFGLGPLTGKFFSDHGATVIRVESSTRPDPTRMFPPFANNKPGLNRSVFWAHYNTGKLSISLSMNHPKSKEIARRLIEWCDILIENFTPGVMEKWGLTYEEVRKVKPDIILIRIANLGHTGPHSTQRGTGAALQCLAGFTELTGWPDRGPAMPFGAISDMYPPMLAAATAIAALLYRRRTGKGQYFDFSQLECSIPFLGPLILGYIVNNRILSRTGNKSPRAAPHGVYRCKGEDRWCAIAVFNEEEWRSFCQVLGNPAWAANPRFGTFQGRKAHEDELDQLIGEWTQSRTSEEVMRLMQAAGVPAGVVNDPEDMFKDAQLTYRDHFPKIEHPEIGTFIGRRDAFRFSGMKTQLKRSPLLGEHTETVCKEFLGMSEEEYIELLIEGVFA